jgi:hypothetical protein
MHGEMNIRQEDTKTRPLQKMMKGRKLNTITGNLLRPLSRCLSLNAYQLPMCKALLPQDKVGQFPCLFLRRNAKRSRSSVHTAP